jgi:hypothetical protein
VMASDLLVDATPLIDSREGCSPCVSCDLSPFLCALADVSALTYFEKVVDEQK